MRRFGKRIMKERVGTQGRYMSDEDIAAQYADFWADWIEKRPNGISINVVYPSADEEDYDSSVVFWMKKRDGKWYDFNGNWAPDDVIGKIIKITDVADKVMGDSDEISFENPEEFYSWLRKNKSIRESRRPRGRILREGMSYADEMRKRYEISGDVSDYAEIIVDGFHKMIDYWMSIIKNANGSEDIITEANFNEFMQNPPHIKFDPTKGKFEMALEALRYTRELCGFRFDYVFADKKQIDDEFFANELKEQVEKDMRKDFIAIQDLCARKTKEFGGYAIEFIVDFIDYGSKPLYGIRLNVQPNGNGEKDIKG